MINAQQNPGQKIQNDKYSNQSEKAGESHAANENPEPRVGNNIQKDEPLAKTGMKDEPTSGNRKNNEGGHKATTSF